jgi:hypothetical protein
VIGVTAIADRRPYVEKVNQSTLLRPLAETLRTLDQAFRWALRQEPPLRPIDVIIQDEYTHDVLFHAADSSYLVFDAT